jgi:hypothetical protein
MGNIIIKQGRSSGPGSSSIIRAANKKVDPITGIALEVTLSALQCSPESDGTTTYTQKKEWSPEIGNYKFPPFVDCEYVD